MQGVKRFEVPSIGSQLWMEACERYGIELPAFFGYFDDDGEFRAFRASSLEIADDVARKANSFQEPGRPSLPEPPAEVNTTARPALEELAGNLSRLVAESSGNRVEVRIVDGEIVHEGVTVHHD